MTTRTPPFSDDSSRRSEISLILPSVTTSAIFLSRPAPSLRPSPLVTW
jgi:hypothetical protein